MAGVRQRALNADAGEAWAERGLETQGSHLSRKAELAVVLIDHQQSAGLGDRPDDGRDIERAQRSEVDDLA